LAAGLRAAQEPRRYSEESLRALAKRYGINQKTVAKWKKRTAVKDLPTGPKAPHSTVLSIEEEAVTVKRYHYDSHDQLRQHLGDFVTAYNFARRLKTLKGLTPYEAICKAWQNDPNRFTSNPHHQMPGPNT